MVGVNAFPLPVPAPLILLALAAWLVQAVGWLPPLESAPVLFLPPHGLNARMIGGTRRADGCRPML